MTFTYVENEKTAKIKVIGVGGAGGNAINNMIDAQLQGVKFIAANTDAQALDVSKAPIKIQLGSTLTEGLGAGANPSVGREAATESEAEIREALKDSHMVFITAGLGGGTGTGAAPVVARIAKELGALTVAVASRPFSFEGKKRLKQAEEGLEELKNVADTVITIPNDRLRGIAHKNARMVDMFKKADEILHHSVKGITDLIMVPGLVNLDFADVRTTMSKAGMALMGIGIASGENRAVEAAERAISHPLLEDISIAGAKGLLMNVTSTSEITMDEMTEAMDRIYSEVGEDAEIIWGHAIDETLGEELRITVIATGIGTREEMQARAANVILHRTQNPRSAVSSPRGKLRDVTPEDLENPGFHDSGVIQRKKAVGDDVSTSLQDIPEIKKGNIDRDDLEIPTFLRRKAD
ncbi:cell division protein FtsZ [Desulfobotulus sp.]|jgi:cell division protein FtsZ|uniref:cell division protein FtsZ n=1 Tax=Desulfobotulus sp. TaxID=1940337 RepID=UPI002A363C3B|nr:cell division protein FtsZ [Desulfobotulus sp.]MDY0164003.1 cell division protein FtsZ [Desulfobotulus sp.]